MKQYSTWMERLWLSIGVAIGIFAIYTLVTKGLQQSLFHFLFAATAVAMFFIRKRMNKTLHKQLEEREKRNKQ